MPRERGSLLANMNFDSLADTITNLAGTLILVVVLVLGITRPAARLADRLADGRRPIGPLADQLVALRQQTQQLDDEIGRLEARVRELQAKAGAKAAPETPAKPAGPQKKAPPAKGDVVAWPAAAVAALALADPGTTPPDPSAQAAALDEAVRQMQAAMGQTGAALRNQGLRLSQLREAVERLRKEQPARPPGSKTGQKPDRGKKQVKQIVYRPPIEEFTEKKRIWFLCRGDRVNYLDVEALFKRAAVEAKGRAGKDPRNAVEFSDGVYHIRAAFGKRDDALVAEMEIRPGSDRAGETWEEIERPDSRFQRELRPRPGRDPASHFVHFTVWPDAYETFRRARSIAWREGFKYDAAWWPQTVGEPMRLVTRPGPAPDVVPR